MLIPAILHHACSLLRFPFLTFFFLKFLQVVFAAKVAKSVWLKCRVPNFASWMDENCVNMLVPFRAALYSKARRKSLWGSIVHSLCTLSEHLEFTGSVQHFYGRVE